MIHTSLVCQHLRFCASTAFALLASTAFAGGFALVEQNANGAGVAWSNAAAAADASTVFYNPAGLTRIPRPEIVGGLHAIDFSTKYRERGSTVAGALPLGGGSGGNGGSLTPLPNLYYAQPILKDFAFGVGLSVPWGLSTDYDAGWIGRYHALKSELKTLNLSPAFAWRVNEQLSVGAGLQVQRASVTLGNAIDFGLIGASLKLPGMAPGSADGAVSLTGDDTAYGYTVGFLHELYRGTRIGASFRSKVAHNFDADATFSGVPAPFAAMFANQRARSSMPTPATISVHGLQDIGSWRFTADATFWRFASFRTLAVDFQNPATPDSEQLQNWKNAAIYSFGAEYLLTDALSLRGGIAYNSSPVPNAALRNPRIPDSDRRWIACGLVWRAARGLTVHAGLTRLFFTDGEIDNVDAQTHRLRGSFDTAATIFSAQAAWRF